MFNFVAEEALFRFERRGIDVYIYIYNGSSGLISKRSKTVHSRRRLIAINISRSLHILLRLEDGMCRQSA